jgi:3-deoxy-manno-octulosonate cytidylyltransferase (CMP-KDO synthetase)
MNIYKIIPFRLQSQRFPNKPLCIFLGKTLIETSLDIANTVTLGNTILTGPEEDFLKVKESIPGLHKKKFTFIPTSRECKSATERVMEISLELKGDLYISIPMDEPSIIPGELEKGLSFSLEHNPGVLTLYCDFYCEEDARSTLSAKIVTDNRGHILYMSRSIIPIRKNGTLQLSMLKKNVGVFYFRGDFLRSLVEYREVNTSLDTYEGLEQLRWLELGHSIHVQKIIHYGFGIDIPDQVKQLEKRITCLPQRGK